MPITAYKNMKNIGYKIESSFCKELPPKVSKYPQAIQLPVYSYEVDQVISEVGDFAVYRSLDLHTVVCLWPE